MTLVDDRFVAFRLELALAFAPVDLSSDLGWVGCFDSTIHDFKFSIKYFKG